VLRDINFLLKFANRFLAHFTCRK